MPSSFFSCSRTDRIPIHSCICCATVLCQAPHNVCRYACEAIRYFPKAVSCLWENACGFHNTWHQSCTREGSQDMGQYLLKGFNVKTRCYLITDGADYLIVGYWGGRVYHDSAEHLVVYVAVQMFLRPSRCSDRPAAFAIRSNGNTE